jgi:hypothetical protein
MWCAEADGWGGVEIEKGEYEQDAEAYELFHEEAKGIVGGGGICLVGEALVGHVVFR